MRGGEVKFGRGWGGKIEDGKWERGSVSRGMVGFGIAVWEGNPRRRFNAEVAEAQRAQRRRTPRAQPFEAQGKQEWLCYVGELKFFAAGFLIREACGPFSK